MSVFCKAETIISPDTGSPPFDSLAVFLLLMPFPPLTVKDMAECSMLMMSLSYSKNIAGDLGGSFYLIVFGFDA